MIIAQKYDLLWRYALQGGWNYGVIGVSIIQRGVSNVQPVSKLYTAL